MVDTPDLEPREEIVEAFGLPKELMGGESNTADQLRSMYSFRPRQIPAEKED